MFGNIKRTKQLKSIIRQHNKSIKYVKQINRGYYGYVFLITDPFGKKSVAKVYKKDDYAKREMAQLEMLAKHSLAHIPEIYAIDTKKQNGFFDILFMEFIDGVDASKIKVIDEKEKMRLSNEIVDNLIAIHSVSDPNGFGDFVSGNYFERWQDYYKLQIDSLFDSLKSDRPNKFSKQSFSIAEKLYYSFDDVFCLEVKQNSLIHGDYNLWNLMVDPATNRLAAVIDPFGCSFADRELDLFQLQNSNGNEYRLLENYASKIPLSEIFEIKNAYYRFWDDIKHLVNVGYCDNDSFCKYGNMTLELLNR